MSINHGTAVQFIVIAITAGTPLIYAALGELLAERSGVMNLGIEGMMLVGAVAAYAGDQFTHSVWVGVLLGALAAAALAAPFALLTISLKASQVVSGIALVILGTGISGFLGSSGHEPLTERTSVGSFTAIIHGGPANWPVIGPIIFGQDALVYLSWLLAVAVSVYLFHTRFGLRLRAVGRARPALRRLASPLRRYVTDTCWWAGRWLGSPVRI